MPSISSTLVCLCAVATLQDADAFVPASLSSQRFTSSSSALSPPELVSPSSSPKSSLQSAMFRVVTSLFMGEESDEKPSTWPGDRPPLAQTEIYLERMDAGWGRGKYRSEVWDDDVNPLDQWWYKYSPSQEEMEAANAGYNLGGDIDEEYFQRKNINVEEAKAKFESAKEAALETYKNEASKNIEYTPEMRKRFEDLLQMNKAMANLAIRIKDNQLQQSKGQPSLDMDNDSKEKFANDDK